MRIENTTPRQTRTTAVEYPSLFWKVDVERFPPVSPVSHRSEIHGDFFSPDPKQISDIYLVKSGNPCEPRDWLRGTDADQLKATLNNRLLWNGLLNQWDLLSSRTKTPPQQQHRGNPSLHSSALESYGAGGIRGGSPYQTGSILCVCGPRPTIVVSVSLSLFFQSYSHLFTPIHTAHFYAADLPLHQRPPPSTNPQVYTNTAPYLHLHSESPHRNAKSTQWLRFDLHGNAMMQQRKYSEVFGVFFLSFFYGWRNHQVTDQEQFI